MLMIQSSEESGCGNSILEITVSENSIILIFIVLNMGCLPILVKVIFLVHPIPPQSL